MLNQPAYVTRFLGEFLNIDRKRFILDRVFSNGGGVTGGGVIYEEMAANDLYTTRDVERVEPGAEFPLVTTNRRSVKIATPEKWGGKFFITDEARDRNDARMLFRHTTQLGNTIIRKLNQRAIEEFEAKITGLAGAATVTGQNWSNIQLNGSTPTANSATPIADFAAVALLADQREQGTIFDTWIINPVQLSRLRVAYQGVPGGIDAIARDFGITTIFATQEVAVGTAYVVSSGNVGEYRVESPLGTEAWREQETQRTWVQSSVRPLFFIDNPMGLLKVTGLGA